MKDKMIVFSGPCVLESEELAMEIAGSLKEQLNPLNDKIQLVFKGSFDKANRTSIDSYRGPGIEKGLKILEKVKSEFGLPVVTDFHFPNQADDVASVVDYLQVPAFLSRQTDMIVEGALACKKYGRVLKIKKAQFMSPADVEFVVAKATSILEKDSILLTERGTCFGYNQLIVDMASFYLMRQFK